MEAKDHLGLGRSFDAQALGADRHAAVAADLDRGAEAPDVIPPRAAGDGTQDGTFFFAGLIPGPLRGLAQFPMDFMGVAMCPQGVNLRIGHFDFGNLFAGEVGGQPTLPVLVGAFDFAFGLGRGGIEETDVVELERPAQLGQRVGIVREKNAVVIHIDAERASVGQKSGRQEIKVGEQQFTLINLGTREQTAAIIEQVEHGKGKLGVRKPAVGRSIELPEFADLRALPAAHGCQNLFWRAGMGEIIFQRPAANLGAVELEGMKAQGFGSGEAVRTRRLAGQTLFQEIQDGLGPRLGMIATRNAGDPKGFLLLGAGEVVSGGQSVKATGRESELFSGLGGGQRLLLESIQHMTDEGGSVAMDELLMLFKDAQNIRLPSPPPVFSSGIASLALLKDGRWTGRFLFC